jgi:hypothetical protein
MAAPTPQRIERRRLKTDPLSPDLFSSLGSLHAGPFLVLAACCQHLLYGARHGSLHPHDAPHHRPGPQPRVLRGARNGVPPRHGNSSATAEPRRRTTSSASPARRRNSSSPSTTTDARTSSAPPTATSPSAWTTLTRRSRRSPREGSSPSGVPCALRRVVALFRPGSGRLSDRDDRPAQGLVATPPARGGLPTLRKAGADCKACDLWKTGTLTAFGEGTSRAEVIRDIEQAPERRAELWHVLSVGHEGEAARELAALDERLEELWNEHRQVRATLRFGERDAIIERARAEERLHRAGGGQISEQRAGQSLFQTFDPIGRLGIQVSPVGCSSSTVKAAPNPGSDCTSSRPPILCTNSREM